MGINGINIYPSACKNVKGRKKGKRISSITRGTEACGFANEYVKYLNNRANEETARQEEQNKENSSVTSKQEVSTVVAITTTSTKTRREHRRSYVLKASKANGGKQKYINHAFKRGR